MVRREYQSLREYEPSTPEILQQQDAEPDVRAYLSMLVRRRRFIAAVIAGVFLLGMLYTITRRKVYESPASIVVLTIRNSPPLSESDMPAMGDLQALRSSRTTDTQVVVASSRDVLEEAFASLGAEMRLEGFGGNKLPDWAWKVEKKKNADVIVITGRAYTAEGAAAFAGAVADTYFKRDMEQNSYAARQARQYAEKQMLKAERDLAEANSRLARFKRETGFFAPDTQLTKAAENMAQLTLDLNMARAEASSSQNELTALRRQMSSQGSQVVASTTLNANPEYQAILAKMDQLNSDRVALLQEYTPNSREVKEMNTRIEHEVAKLRRIAKTVVGSKVQARNPVRDTLVTKYITDMASLAASQRRVRALQSELGTYRESAKNLPDHERRYAELTQQVALRQRLYDMLSGNYNTLAMSEHPLIPNGVLAAQARIPEKPVYPDVKRSALLLLVLGVLFALLGTSAWERLDNRLHDQSMVEQLTGLPTLTIVPEIPQDSGKHYGAGGRYWSLLESFRILRNNIGFALGDRQTTIIAVTSPGRGEGKSTVTVNLGAVLAMQGKRVLLVDGHMRSPALHRLLDVPCDTGLCTAIMGESAPEESVWPVPIENMYCLPCGPIPQNPVELLGSKSGRQVFLELAAQYDVVLIDCPPCTGVSDVQTISTIADAMLLVVSMNRTLKPQLHMTMTMLMQAGAPLVGLALNHMETHHGSYGYYCYELPLAGYGETPGPRPTSENA